MKTFPTFLELSLMQQLHQSYAIEECHQYFNLLESMFKTSLVTPSQIEDVQIVDDDETFIIPTSLPDSKLYLTVESTLPEPAYKDRGFTLALALRGSQGSIVTPLSQLYFKLSVCTHEAEPKLITHNFRGQPILRGTADERVNRDGSLIFPNIIITEVSSRYVGGCFNLMIYPSKYVPVTPLVISKISVKAKRVEKQFNR